MNAALVATLFAGIALLSAGTFCALIGPPEAAESLLAIGALMFIPAYFALLGRHLEGIK